MPSGWVDVHTGGTYYVAPRGPYLHKNPGQLGDEHLFMPALSLESGAHAIFMYHSDDYGETWSRTSFVTAAQISFDTQDWVALDWDVEGSICHLAFLESDGSTGNVFYAGFNMDTLTIETAPEAVHTGFSSFDTNGNLHIALAARDGTANNGNGVALQYWGPEFRSMGSGFTTTWYGYKSSGSWTTGQLSPSGVSENYNPYSTIRGSNGDAHFAYILQSTSLSGTLVSRTLSSANGLSAQDSIFGNSEVQDIDVKYRQSRMLHYTQDDGGTKYTINGDFQSTQRYHADRYDEVGGVLDTLTARQIVNQAGDPPAMSSRHDSEQIWTLVGCGSPFSLRAWYSDDHGFTWNGGVEGTVFEASVSSFGFTAPSDKTYLRADNNQVTLGYVHSQTGSTFQFGDAVVQFGSTVDIGIITEVNTPIGFESFSVPNRVVVAGWGQDQFTNDPHETHIWLATDDTLTNWERRGPTRDYSPVSAVFSPERSEYVILERFTASHLSKTAGKSWVTTDPQTISGGWSLTWCNELELYLAYVLGGQGPAYSPDGVNWTHTGVDLGGTVDWSPELGLALIAGPDIWTSPDLINWTKRTNLHVDQDISDTCWSPELGIWVAGGNGTGPAIEDPIYNGLFWYSYDGITWTESPGNPHSLNPDSRQDQAPVAISWSPDLGMFMAGWRGNPTATSNIYDTYVATSTDGINWTVTLIFADADWGTNGSAVYDDPGMISFSKGAWIPQSQKFLVTTGEGGVWTSPDALNWSRDLVLPTYQRQGGIGVSLGGLAFIPDPKKTGLIGTIAEQDTLQPIEVVQPLQTVNIGVITETEILIDAEVQAGGGFAGWGIPI